MANSESEDENEVNDSELSYQEMQEFFKEMFKEHKIVSTRISYLKKEISKLTS